MTKRNYRGTNTKKNSIGQTLKEGATLGLGMGVGSHAAHAIFNSLSSEPKKVDTDKKCQLILEKFKDCVNLNYNDISLCNYKFTEYMDCINSPQ